MAIMIAPYTEDRVPAVRAFNQRLAASNGHGEFRFPESAVPDLPPGEGRGIYQEYFLALENGNVRGAFMLRHQPFVIAGEVRTVAHYRLPLSEGVLNKAYAGVAAQMLRSALKRQPLLFALGMGGTQNPLPRMLRAVGWTVVPVPFYFRVENARAFLRNVRPLRTSRMKAFLADAAAFTGAGAVGIGALHAWRTRDRLRTRFEIATSFGDREDALWRLCGGLYSLAAVRDCRVLNTLYPTQDPRFLRIRAGDAGWAVALDTKMHGHKYFGDLRVGSIVDCMAKPERAREVIAAAVESLRGRGVDLIVSNQSHAAWGGALTGAGFLKGPSNFAFAASKQLAGLVDPFEARFGETHINRGDGDGPINL